MENLKRKIHFEILTKLMDYCSKSINEINANKVIERLIKNYELQNYNHIQGTKRLSLIDNDELRDFCKENNINYWAKSPEKMLNEIEIILAQEIGGIIKCQFEFVNYEDLKCIADNFTLIEKITRKFINDNCRKENFENQLLKIDLEEITNLWFTKIKLNEYGLIDYFQSQSSNETKIYKKWFDKKACKLVNSLWSRSSYAIVSFEIARFTIEKISEELENLLLDSYIILPN